MRSGSHHARDKDLRRLLQRAERAGAVVDKTGRGHLKLTVPGRPGVVFMASSPSDYCSVSNAHAQLRKTFPGLLDEVKR